MLIGGCPPKEGAVSECPVAGNKTRRKLFFVVAIALASRLAIVPFVCADRLDPKLDHWNFAWETGKVAYALVTGHGYSSPFAKPSGPTALVAPMFPLLVALVFRIFGAYSRASAVAVLSPNSTFSALTCIPIFFAARRTFGSKVATWSVWGWAVFPYAIYFGAGVPWTHALNALLMAALLALILRLQDPAGWLCWGGLGLLAGIAALSNPVVLGTFPFLLVWVCWRICLANVAPFYLHLDGFLEPRSCLYRQRAFSDSQHFILFQPDLADAIGFAKGSAPPPGGELAIALVHRPDAGDVLHHAFVHGLPASD